MGMFLAVLIVLLQGQVADVEVIDAVGSMEECQKSIDHPGARDKIHDLMPAGTQVVAKCFDAADGKLIFMVDKPNKVL